MTFSQALATVFFYILQSAVLHSLYQSYNEHLAVLNCAEEVGLMITIMMETYALSGFDHASFTAGYSGFMCMFVRLIKYLPLAEYIVSTSYSCDELKQYCLIQAHNNNLISTVLPCTVNQTINYFWKMSKLDAVVRVSKRGWQKDQG